MVMTDAIAIVGSIAEPQVSPPSSFAIGTSCMTFAAEASRTEHDHLLQSCKLHLLTSQCYPDNETYDCRLSLWAFTKHVTRSLSSLCSSRVSDGSRELSSRPASGICGQRVLCVNALRRVAEQTAWYNSTPGVLQHKTL